MLVMHSCVEVTKRSAVEETQVILKTDTILMSLKEGYNFVKSGDDMSVDCMPR